MNITWEHLRSMPVLIKGGAMGIVNGVPVYAAGCTFPWRESEQAWFWDAGQGDWFPVEPNLTLGRAYTSGITLRDGLLVLGGRKSHGQARVSLRDAWWLRRNDSAFSWTQLPDMNYPRALASIGVAGEQIVVFGGGEWERSQGGAFATRHLTHYEILDLTHLSSGWRDMGPLPCVSLVGSAFASVGQSTYFFGGYECWTEQDKKQIQRYAVAWRYDFSTDTWTRRADFPGIASGWCAAPYKNTIILLGGCIELNMQGVCVPYETCHILKPGTPRQRLVGGYSNLAFAYNIEADTYRVMASRMPIGVNGPCCAISGNIIYAAGGETVDTALSNTTDAFLIGRVEE